MFKLHRDLGMSLCYLLYTALYILFFHFVIGWDNFSYAMVSTVVVIELFFAGYHLRKYMEFVQKRNEDAAQDVNG